MQSRINRLENLVLSLMTNGPQAVGQAAAAALIADSTSPGSSEELQMPDADNIKDSSRDEDSEVERVSTSIGVMKVNNDRQYYASEAHWWTILSDIAEVKRYFAEHQKQYEEQVRKVTALKSGESGAATSLLFRGTTKTDRAKLLGNFPTRPVADKLVIRHFETDSQSIRILHCPTFKREYERHWVAPHETPVAWLALCFAMMSMALQSYHRTGDEPAEYRGRSRELSATYSDWAAQCLVHADFTQPVVHMLEALCFYFQAEYSRSRDAETGLWMLSGIITRLSMRMGLHRDSAPYAPISPFKGEMRRRIWAFIRSSDILFSFQCGLPNMIRSTDCDTALPSNIYDEEFDEDASALPAARPQTEATPISFMIAHTRMVFILGKIQESSTAIGFPSYDTTMKLDEELREDYAQIPEHLRLQGRDQSSLDTPDTVMQRFTLDLTYHKSMCVLHRKFLGRARRDSRYWYSRKTCIDASMEMLAHQSTLHIEIQPGSRLRSIAWSMATSLTTHDFLLAAMIICLDLYHTAQSEAQGNTSGEMYQWALERRSAMFETIERAVSIWETLRDQSLEAYKASSVLKVMLEKLKNHQVLRQQLQSNFSFVSDNNGVAADGHVAPEHSAAMTLGLLSSGGVMTPETMGMYDRAYLQPARTGVTPQPTKDELGVAPMAHMDPGTPFSSLFGSNFGGFQSLDIPGASLDWVSHSAGKLLVLPLTC